MVEMTTTMKTEKTVRQALRQSKLRNRIWGGNQATAKTLATIADYCDNVLAFLRAVAVKSLQFTAAPLSLCVDKRVCIWFCRWSETNLPTPSKLVPQEHMGITGLMTDVETRLQTA